MPPEPPNLLVSLVEIVARSSKDSIDFLDVPVTLGFAVLRAARFRIVPCSFALNPRFRAFVLPTCARLTEPANLNRYGANPAKARCFLHTLWSALRSFAASALGIGLAAVILVWSSQHIAARSPQRPSYFDDHVPSPRLFAEGVISTEDDEINGSFSLDGAEYFFAKVNLTTTFPRIGILCVSRFRNGHWNEPEVLPFSGGEYLDLSPRISPDGATLFFSSSRPAAGFSVRALRVWSVQRTAAGWGDPQPLPAPINTTDRNWNWGASVTRDGTLYFASTRDAGHPHIFRARFAAGAYSEPEELSSEINSKFSDFDPFVSPDETILVFASSGVDLFGIEDRPETLKGEGVLYPRSDLYLSSRHDGLWSSARHLEH